MAVKPEKIKERLKALYPKANLSQKRIDEISAKLAKKSADDAEDGAIDSVITDANDLMDFEALAKEDDRIRTLEAKAKQPEPNTDPKKEEEEKGDDAPAWAKAMMQKMEAIEKGEVVKSKQSSISSAFEKSEVLKNLKPNLKEAWLKRIAVTDDLTDEQIAEHITSLENEYQEITQNVADNQDYSGATPSFTERKGEATVDDIRKFYED